MSRCWLSWPWGAAPLPKRGQPAERPQRDAPGVAELAELPPLLFPGLVLVGSHAPLTDAQLAELQQQPGCARSGIPADEPNEALRSQLSSSSC